MELLLFTEVETQKQAETDNKISLDELIQKLKDGLQITAIMSDGEKARLFFSNQGNLCKFRKGSSRRGYPISYSDIVQINEKEAKDKDVEKFKTILKFRNQALKATFTNKFIDACLVLPSSFEQWQKEGKKSAYEYNITTGCGITGNLVSVKTIAEKLRWRKEAFLEALRERKTWDSGTFEYNGYDGSINLKMEDNGEFKGFLNKEYRNCGNGYYYLLINDDYFIGYDID